MNAHVQKFLSSIEANYALASVVAIEVVRGKTVRLTTADEHAQHAVEHFARRAGLKPSVSRVGATFTIVARVER
mgnify:CR=1 FL=1